MVNNSMHTLRCVAHGRILAPLAEELQTAGVCTYPGPLTFNPWAKDVIDVVLPPSRHRDERIAGILMRYINENRRSQLTRNADGAIKEVRAISNDELMGILRETKVLEIDG